MCQFDRCHICIIQITGICLWIYLTRGRCDMNLCLISLYLRCNIETLHFTPIICWTQDSREREEGGKRNQFRAGDLLSADLSNTPDPGPAASRENIGLALSCRQGLSLVHCQLLLHCYWSHRPWRHGSWRQLCGPRLCLLVAVNTWPGCEEPSLVNRVESYREYCDAAQVIRAIYRSTCVN